MEAVGERVIRFSRVKLFLPFVPLAVLVGISVAWDFERWRNASPWVYGTFAAIGLLLLAGCVVLPRRYYVQLSAEGLTLGYITGKRFYRWTEVRNFRTATTSVNDLPAGNRIVFDLAEGSPHRTSAVKLAALVNRYDVSFLAVFNVSAEELVGLLKDWHERYGSMGNSESS